MPVLQPQHTLVLGLPSLNKTKKMEGGHKCMKNFNWYIDIMYIESYSSSSA